MRSDLRNIYILLLPFSSDDDLRQVLRSVGIFQALIVSLYFYVDIILKEINLPLGFFVMIIASPLLHEYGMITDLIARQTHWIQCCSEHVEGHPLEEVCGLSLSPSMPRVILKVFHRVMDHNQSSSRVLPVMLPEILGLISEYGAKRGDIKEKTQKRGSL